MLIFESIPACGTGQIVDVSFLDESVHLISACQVAGFRHVIGTSWEIKDESCIEIAKMIIEGSSVSIRGPNEKRSLAQISCASPKSSPLEVFGVLDSSHVSTVVSLDGVFKESKFMIAQRLLVFVRPLLAKHAASVCK